MSCAKRSGRGQVGFRAIQVALTAALLSVHSASAGSRSVEDPISTGTTVAIGVTILLGEMTIDGLIIGSQAASHSVGGSTGGSNRQPGRAPAEKRILAVAAIEDAARYFATGELGGVLPAALARLRELSPEAATQDDAELVDALVTAAESLLSVP
jgi:hypothetical protein